ncbi:MAG: hypothetical protein KJ000_24365 [Pirellulaceae bacterium]|nr:hypothetical protein [Pirellulaceae bacterium]
MDIFVKMLDWLMYSLQVLLSLLLHLRIWMLGLLALGVGAWSWRYAGRIETPRPVPATLTQATEAACRRVPSALPRPDRVLRPTLVLPLADDRESLVTGTLRQVLNADGRYRPVDPGLVQRLLDEFFELAGAPRQPVADAESALRIARNAGAEVALFGRVERLELHDQRAEVTFRLEAVEVESERSLLADTFSSTPPAAHRGSSSPSWPWWLGILAVAVVWPPLTVPVMARVLRRESNLATLLTIVAITAVPAAIAWPVFFGADTSVWRVILFTLGLLLTAFWSALVMSWVAASQDSS